MATTDQTLLSRVQYALLEPADGGQSWPSQLWSRDEMLNYVNERQDGFLHDTFLLVGIANVAVAIGDSILTLPTDWIRTVSAVWRGNDGVIVELQRADSFEADHAESTWDTVDATPRFYTDEDVVTSGTIRIGPAPTVAGTLEILYAPLGTTLNGNGEILVVPDDFSQAVKYGVLAEALKKDGRGQDLQRASYCNDRVDLLRMVTEIILKGWG